MTDTPSGRAALESVLTVQDLASGPFTGLRRAVLGGVVAAGLRPFLNGRVGYPTRRRVLSRLGKLTQPIPSDVTLDEVELGGRRTWRFTPDGAASGRTLLYLHGGGYNYGDVGTHGAAVATLASNLAATIWMPDYRLRPEHPATAPLEDAMAAWRELVADHDPALTLVAGDSAGGHLALSLACEARDADDLPSPAGLVLLSPWVDTDPALIPDRPNDRIITRALMERDAAAWLDGAAPSDPHYSPIHRDLHGLPPTLVQWGERESLHQDAERLVAKLVESGVDVTAEAFRGMWHDAFLHVPTLVESGRWLARTAVWGAQQVRRGGR